jgi:periplasmic divalent cation tolerance protein
MNEFISVHITTKDKVEAQFIGKALLEERLVACINVIENVYSSYWWEGQIEESNEAILIAKTKAAHLQLLIGKVKDLHSYANPCIVALPIIEGSSDYLAWLAKETKRSK